MMLSVGFIGWRGMVGSVLLERMRQQHDFEAIEAVFFSTSNAGAAAPIHVSAIASLQDAYALGRLAELDVLVSCQGSDYTERIYPQLRQLGWQGYWLDAASTLRLHTESVIPLDPVNGDLLEKALAEGVKTFVGGNCTVSLLLMALAGLCQHKLIEWINVATYQSASGGGAQAMRELLQQIAMIHQHTAELLADPASSILAIDRQLTQTLSAADFPRRCFGSALAGSVLPWIDEPYPHGQSREEWKAQVEGNKILGNPTQTLLIDGLCVRVGAMRCHSQALSIKLNQDIALSDISAILAKAHPWVQVVPNEREQTLQQLTPAAISGQLHVAIGRLHKLNFGPHYLSAFTCGDQLLWGAAEPLRRMLALIVAHNS